MSRFSFDKARLAGLLPFLVALLTFAVFLPALKAGFVWDDIPNLVDNLKFRGLGPQQLKWMFTTFHMNHYIPLSWVTLGADNLVWGMNPVGYHLTNVLLHSVNALLFYFLCVRLLALAIRPAGAKEQAELRFSAAFAALFFAVHPLRAESVVWVTERRDVLAGFFYLLAAFLYLSARSPGEEQTSVVRRHLAPLGAFILALFSKSMAVTLPAVLLVLDIYPLRRLPAAAGWFSPASRRIWLEKLPYFLLSAVFSFVAYFLAGKPDPAVPALPSDYAPSCTKAVFAVVFYIQKTLLPFALSPFYKLPAAFAFPGLRYLCAIAAIAAVSAVALALRRRRPALLAAWVYYLIALSPAAGFFNAGPQAALDRYTYLPCLGFAMLGGAGLRAGLRAGGGRARNICAVLACLVIAGLAALTWRQEGIWRDEGTLWRHALALNPQLDYAHYNLGVVLAARGMTDEAAAHYAEAMRLNPAYADAHNNLGLLLAGQGRDGEAEAQYREALRIYPAYADAHNNLGTVLAARGRLGEAEAQYREALRLKPDMAAVHGNLGIVLNAQGRTAEAAGQYREALRLYPAYARAHCNLGVILAAQGEPDEAARHYREALKIDPDYAFAYYNLARVLAARGELNEAAKNYLEALRAAPDLAEAHYNLSFILAAQGERKQAEEHYREALRLKPALGAPAR